MNLPRLANQLKNEAKKSPAKVAVLSGLVLVGIYFWAPLLLEWFGGGSKAALETITEQVASLDLLPASQPEVETAVAEFDWYAVNQWIEQDEQMNSAILAEELLDPFREGAILKSNARKKQNKKKKDEEDAKKEITPDDLRLELTSTIVGPRGRFAIIKGKQYIEGGTISITAESLLADEIANADEEEGDLDDSEESIASKLRVPAVRFTLVKVRTRSVTLSRNGIQYVLSMPEPQLEGKDYFSTKRRTFSDI